MSASSNNNDDDALLTLLGKDLQLWSPSLQTHNSKPADVIANKIVLLYFSASWCPPCARFSPILKAMYKKLKAGEGQQDFELLFVSLDKTQESYDQYTADMPWYCLPYPTPLLGPLASRYAGGQLAIPLLVVLDNQNDRRVITTDGVGEVSTDPDGIQFPWRPRPFTELFPEHYIDGADKTTFCPMSDLKDKYLMLYFSAHWCPPCRAFTPKLSKAYRELKQSAHGNEFELLFVSSDRNDAGFTEYFGEMSFGAIPYHERDAKTALSSRLRVQGIPRLVMLGPVDPITGDRPVVNDNVRACIERGNVVADFPFAPKRFGNVNDAAEDINACRCVIVFYEGGDDEEQQEVQQTLTAAVDQVDDASLKFFWALSPDGMAKSIRDALKLGPIRDEPVMVLLDLADQGAYYVASDATEITVESIARFVGSPGERKQL